MSFIMQLDHDVLIDLLGESINKEFEEKQYSMLWEQWLVDYAKFTEKTFVPFDKYIEKAKKAKTTKQLTDEQILEDAQSILKSMNRSK
ncbi:hypothetical protein [Paraliobacillus sediminis]|uniref:hypothetical protein n=1 Tax=Paraliobacillus sediminis TaxID=1885916 RepID=UPI000E3BE78B|nr:hypothetical protein [Paraliobacillus sediminis]